MTNSIKTFSTPSDAPSSEEVVKLILAAFRESSWKAEDKPNTPEEVLKILGDIYARKFLGVFARTEEGKLAAIAFATSEVRDEKPFFWVWTLCVDPDSQGRGLARVLTQKIINEAVSQGMNYVDLGTQKGTPAESLYESLGFQICTPRTSGRIAMRHDLQSLPIAETPFTPEFQGQSSAIGALHNT